MTAATLPNFKQRINARRRPSSNQEIVIDSFAGWGGWGLGEEAATGYAVDVAINHDPMAIEAHRINHPATVCYEASVYEVDPREVCPGRSIAHCHFSPDCTHHSKARGTAPVSDRVRGLAWVSAAWMHLRRPRVITLENVEEFRHWGPTEDRDGKRFPIRSQRGETFAAFIGVLTTGLPGGYDNPALAEIRQAIGQWVPDAVLIRGLGYRVEFRELRASGYGAPTIRKRFFLVARCDNQAIVWPAPTHGDPKSEAVKNGEQLPWETAASCIDFSLPCPSIFMTAAEAKTYYKQTGVQVRRPLKPATLRRIAHGVMRFVVNEPKPFIVPTGYGERAGQKPRLHDINHPLPTVVGATKHALVVPSIVSVQNASSAGIHDGAKPFPTITSKPKGGGHAVVQAFLAKHYGGVVGNDLRQPLGTITQVDHHSLVALSLSKYHAQKGDESRFASLNDPINTLDTSNRFALVAAFLQTYYGNSTDGQSITKPMPTVVTKDRIGLVTAHVGNGKRLPIVDIGMRMLKPHELLRAQFGDMADGWVMLGNTTQQVAGIGNSVCPHVARAIVKANVKIRRISSVA